MRFSHDVAHEFGAKFQGTFLNFSQLCFLFCGGQIWTYRLKEGVYVFKKRYFLHLSINQSTNGPVNAHLISWPTKAQNIQNLENIW